jgi:hypothetical protein
MSSHGERNKRICDEVIVFCQKISQLNNPPISKELFWKYIRVKIKEFEDGHQKLSDDTLHKMQHEALEQEVQALNQIIRDNNWQHIKERGVG